MNQVEIERLLAPYPAMMTVQEVATALRIDPRSVRHWGKSGRLAALQLGRNYRFAKAEVLRWLEWSSTAASQLQIPE
jgi:excisionase family DNA binding protein